MSAAPERHRQELLDRGYTVFERIMDARQLDDLRQAIDDRLATVNKLQDHADAYGEANLAARAPIFRELVQLPAVLTTIESLLGDDCILSSVNLAVRKSSDIAQPLHRDTGIWGASMPWLDVPVGIQTCWCADDFTAENGATRAVPGSHRDPAATDQSPSIPMLAPAGSIIAFDARMLHAGGANRSGRPRRAVLPFYIRSWLKPQTDHKRSIDSAIVAEASPTLRRLLGFRRQSPVERSDGTSEIVRAADATWFYDEVRT